MRAHKTSFYMDDHVRVEFCTVCSAEGELLKSECPGQVPPVDNKNQPDFFDKGVDKSEERS